MLIGLILGLFKLVIASDNLCTRIARIFKFIINGMLQVELTSIDFLSILASPLSRTNNALRQFQGMKFFQADSKIKVLSVIYFMVAQSSMMARATSDSFLLKYFQAESIPLMIMGAASLSIVLALLSTYLCERYQAYGAMRMATAGIIITLIVLIPIVFSLVPKVKRNRFMCSHTCFAKPWSFYQWFSFGAWPWVC